MAAEAQRATGSREQTTAPRIPAHPSSMAATFADANEQRNKLSPQQMVAAFQSFRFGDVCAFDTGAEDLAHAALGQAHACLIALSIATEGEESVLRAVHLRECLDGIGTLVSLAKFAVEGLPR